MGCYESKTKATTEVSKEQFADLNDTNKVPVVDTRLPLDARQVFKLKQSWKGIKRRIEEAGVEMFVRLFRTNAYIKTMFGKFKEMESEDEMRNNEMLETHATFVMSTLDEAMSNMDNYEFVVQTLNRVGGSHRRFEGFKPSNFWLVKGPFLEAMDITLGDRYTDYMRTVYEISITFIIQNLIIGYSMLEEGEETSEAVTLEGNNIGNNQSQQISAS